MFHYGNHEKSKTPWLWINTINLFTYLLGHMLQQHNYWAYHSNIYTPVTFFLCHDIVMAPKILRLVLPNNMKMKKEKLAINWQYKDF